MTSPAYAVHSLVQGKWVAPDSSARPIESAVDGQIIANCGNNSLDLAGMRAYARDVGGPALRALSFHDRARMVKAVATYLNERRDHLYDLSFNTGATLSDHKIDVDGGIGTMFVFASKARREMPDAKIWREGVPEQLGREGQFWGQHVLTSRPGVAVHINAFNFPVWGMLEKLAPTLLAGMPAIVKLATATSYVTEACVRMIMESGLLPDGALQLVSGSVSGLLDVLDCQDVLTFTGSAETAGLLRSNKNLLDNAVTFSAEQDSLNATLLGPDITEGTAGFDVFVKEVVREMTVKAGQKCTAIRRIFVPQAQLDQTIAALSSRLGKVTIGNPRNPDVRMGAL
ncbi:MAG: aldehyde dehydrogenase family protein, partial [Rhodobacteraceae bacterium]|nr:aldehyde dehydrogenase family protein [Paracoccaceae bacterium]